MRKIFSILTLGLLVVLTFAACAQQNNNQPTSLPVITAEVITAESGGISGGLTTQEPPTPATIQPAPGAETVITLDDGNKTLYLHVGDRFLLKLGDMFVWEVNVSDQNVLGRVKNIMVVKGAQGVYEALSPGRVTLEASGDPLCRQSQPPCGMPSILFELTVIVK